MKVVKILCAVFIPPVAAFMQVGFTSQFWINIILSLLFFIPGVIHALWLVLTDQK